MVAEGKPRPCPDRSGVVPARRLLIAAVLALTAACSPAPRPVHTPAEHPAKATRGIAAPGTPPEVDVARARALGRAPRFSWEPWGPAAFERARREGKLVLVDGAAAWCHWCHVMDATTYLDPGVGDRVASRFVAVRFDVDAHPDLAERWGEWGWPATIVLSPDGEQLGAFRGYVPAAELAAHLDAALASRSAGKAAPPVAGPGDRPGRPDELGWIAAAALHQLDGYWDPVEGGWGRRQKAPLGEAIEVEIARAERGDRAAMARALHTIEKQRALIDPVWGGVYQYSAAGHWRAPHFEKLATYQAANLAALARAAKTSARPDVLADAMAIRRYVDAFLSAPDGAFYASQDADLGGHDVSHRFVDGHVYYARDDAGRRAMGIPRVDTATHPLETGRLLEAYARLAGATGDAAVLQRARRAAASLLGRIDGEGRVTREITDGGARRVRFLADAAATALGLLRLHEVAPDPSLRDAAARVVRRMVTDFGGGAGGALLVSTLDPDAIGVFATRSVSLPTSALAARALAAAAVATGDAALAVEGRRVLAAAATPAALESQGRMVGVVVLAAIELGALELSGT